MKAEGARAGFFDLHMHTRYSDGKDTPEEMILAAAEQGMTCAGISDHSHTEGDECGMTPEGTIAFRAEMDQLKRKYAGKIRVLCGLERDYYSDDGLDYDYVIGSVHFLRMADGGRVHVDWTAEKQREGVCRYFDGDWYAFAEAYYGLVSRVVEVTKCDIIGHFDLLTKFAERDPWFDACHPRYEAAWKRAADILLKTGKPFEVNTGAISRGYRTDAYPSREIRQYLRAKGARLILSSDAHGKENVGFAFDRFRDEIRGCGSESIVI